MSHGIIFSATVMFSFPLIGMTMRNILLAISFAVFPCIVFAQLSTSDRCSNNSVSRYEQKRKDLRLQIAEEALRGNSTIESINQIHVEEELLHQCAKLGHIHAAYLYGTSKIMWGNVTMPSAELAGKLGPSIATKLREHADTEYVEGNKWLTIAASGGHLYAMFALADNYLEGKGVTASKFLAIEWYYKAATSALANKARDFAVQCLEKMTNLDAGHPLTMRLSETLYGKKQ